MHRYGGMYADLDMEVLRNMSPLLAHETRPVFSAMQVTAPTPSPSMRCSQHACACLLTRKVSTLAASREKRRLELLTSTLRACVLTAGLIPK